MKMKNTKMKVGVLLTAILTFGFLGVYLYLGSNSSGGSGTVAKGERTYLLINPAFAQSATTDTTFLEQEAGMSIYVNVGASMDLPKAKTVYKSIEKETSDYVVGSVSLPDLPETDEIHCFAHKDGWIVVYYLKAEPVSKIIDWNYNSGGQLTKTKLQMGLEKMALALGATITNASYYDFRYPYADKWMIMIETQESVGTDSFNLKIPSPFTIYERSWLHNTAYGTLTGAQLSLDVFHNVTAEVYYYSDYWSSGYYSYLKIDGTVISQDGGNSASKVAIVLVYRET